MNDNFDSNQQDSNDEYIRKLKAANKAIEKDRNDKGAWFNKGSVLYYLQKYEEVIEALDQVIRIDESDKEAWYNKGNALRIPGRYEESIEAYDRAIAIDGNFKEAWLAKGLSLSGLKRYEAAVEAYERALEIDKSDNNSWLTKGLALFKLGKYEEAIKACDRALKIDGEFKEAWLCKGNALFYLQRYEEAIKALDHVIKIDDKEITACFNKGVTLSELGRYKEAIKAYDRALGIDGDYKEAWLNKGGVLFELKRHEDAVKAYERALEIDGNFKEAWLNKGSTLSDLGRYEDALESYEMALRIDGDYKEAWFCKEIPLFKMGRYEGVLEVYNKTLGFVETIPEYIELKVHKGQILSILKKEWEANQCFTEALNKCKSYLWRNKNDDYFWKLKGQIQISLGKYWGATRSLKSAIKKGRENDSIISSYYSTLGEVYLYRGKYDKAIKACKEATDKDSANINTWLIKGAALYKRGRYSELEEFKHCYEKAIEINSESASGYTSLSELYFELGNMAKAQKMANKALEYDNMLISPIIVKSKILVEQKNYGEALQLLNTANSVESGDIRVQLWELYVQYLQLTYKKDNEEKQKDESDSNYKEELGSIIRKLERLNALAAKVDKPERKRLQGQLLYLLANFYLKNDDIYSAKDRLESCLKVAKGELKRSAKGLLSNIWNRLIKPKWWSWWLNSPVYRWTRRIIFGSVSTFLLLLFGLSIVDITNLSNSTLLNSKVLKELLNVVNPDIPMTMFISSFLIFLLIMPSIISFKAKDFEFELHNLSTYDPTLSPSSIEETIKSLSPKLPESPLYSMPKLKLDEKFIKSGEDFFDKNIANKSS